MSFDLKQDILDAVIQSELLKKNCKSYNCKSYKCKLKCGSKIRNRKLKKNPYPKYSYRTGLTNEKGEDVWGVDSKWLIWEIKNGNGLPKIF